jgi:hypothetical protein
MNYPLRTKLALWAGLGLLFSGTAQAASDSAYWYGTITFEQTRDQVTHQVYEPADSYYPGFRNMESHTRITGRIIYGAGKHRAVTTQVSFHDLDDRRTDQTAHCLDGSTAQSHDYEVSEYTGSATNVDATEGQFWLTIEPDGSYSTSDGYTELGRYQGKHLRHTREFYNGCSNPPTHNLEEEVDLSLIIPPQDFPISGTVSAPGAPTLEGSNTLHLDENTKLKYSWRLTRAVPKLMARIDGPVTFKRGDVVTLDGSKSTGDIRKFEWRFAIGADCGAVPPASFELSMTGSRVSFQALCDFQASLSVTDSTGETDVAGKPLSVVARDGQPWRTQFKRKVGPALVHKLISDYALLGVNRCAKHEFDEDLADHQIHSDTLNLATWLGSGYQTHRVEDSGLFAGIYYVTDPKLEIDRVERVNSSILPGGETYLLNQAKGTLTDLRALAAAVSAHEQIHSTLSQEALSKLGPDGDPAHQIESLLALDPAALQFQADMKIREVETILRDATSEDTVKARLLGQPGMSRPISIWLPTSGGGDPVLRNLGPLGAVGD